MIDEERKSVSWTGNALSARVLFSRPGLASHVWIGYDGGGLLLDTGDGCLRDLLACDCQPATLGGLVYTHGHFDHVGGLHSLLGYLRMIGRTKPLPIFGPSGCDPLWQSVATFERCYADSMPFEIVCKEMEDRQTLEVDGVTIEAFAVVHCGSISTGKLLDQIPAFGYRMSSSGETVALTGDTGQCDSLQILIDGADLAIIEATYTVSR